MRHTRSIFTAAINTAAAVINSAPGIFQELTLAEGETRKRYRLSPYGTFPVVQADGTTIQQVVDREAAEAMARAYNSTRGQLATFHRGIPIYEGHADHQGWLDRNPGHKASAVGRIQSIEAGEDGIYVQAVFNSSGVELIGGGAPRYSGHSPHWGLAPIEGRPGHYRPSILISDALTNHPNIAGNVINSLPGAAIPSHVPATGEPENTDKMKLTPEALKALGFAPEATPTEAEISAAVIKLLGQKADAEAAKNTADTAKAAAEGQVTAANSRNTALGAELEKLRTSAVTTAINSAVADGRITEADKARWTTALNTSYETEVVKLGNLMPAINTTDRLAGGERRGEPNVQTGTTAINSAVNAYAKDHGHDMSTTAGYNAAWDGLRAEKPDLFIRG